MISTSMDFKFEAVVRRGAVLQALAAWVFVRLVWRNRFLTRCPHRVTSSCESLGRRKQVVAERTKTVFILI